MDIASVALVFGTQNVNYAQGVFVHYTLIIRLCVHDTETCITLVYLLEAHLLYTLMYNARDSTYLTSPSVY